MANAKQKQTAVAVAVATVFTLTPAQTTMIVETVKAGKVYLAKWPGIAGICYVNGVRDKVRTKVAAAVWTDEYQKANTNKKAPDADEETKRVRKAGGQEFSKRLMKAAIDLGWEKPGKRKAKTVTVKADAPAAPAAPAGADVKPSTVAMMEQVRDRIAAFMKAHDKKMLKAMREDMGLIAGDVLKVIADLQPK